MAPKRAPGVTEQVKIRQAVLIDELRKLEWSPAQHAAAAANADASYCSAPPATTAARGACSTPPSTPHHAQHRRWHSSPAEQRVRPACVAAVKEDKKRKRGPVEALRVVLGRRPRRESFQKCLAQHL